MTEPSKEALAIADRWVLPRQSINMAEAAGYSCAQEIDALAEKRIAAARELGRQEAWGARHAGSWELAQKFMPELSAADRPAPEGCCKRCKGKGYITCVRTYHGEHDERWQKICPDCGGKADRPAPEGATPTPSFSELADKALRQSMTFQYECEDLARHRCSTPSQDTGQPGCGERWRPIESAPEDGTVVWVYVASAHGLPAFQGSCAYHQDGGWCADELRPVTHWVPIECVYLPPPKDVGGLGSASNTESSPTSTVASPGPTAGDVERADAWLQTNLGDSEDERLWYSSISLRDNLVKLQEAAREELLAQITEPLRDAVAWAIHDALLPPHENNLAIRGILATAALRALADKLTEAK